MEAKFRKKLVEILIVLYLSMAIPKHSFALNLKVYYDETELTRKIIVYDYSKRREKLIRVHEACARRCPNETLSEGYNEPRHRESKKRGPAITDPMLLRLFGNDW